MTDHETCLIFTVIVNHIVDLVLAKIIVYQNGRLRILTGILYVSHVAYSLYIRILIASLDSFAQLQIDSAKVNELTNDLLIPLILSLMNVPVYLRAELCSQTATPCPHAYPSLSISPLQLKSSLPILIYFVPVQPKNSADSPILTLTKISFFSLQLKLRKEVTMNVN